MASRPTSRSPRNGQAPAHAADRRRGASLVAALGYAGYWARLPAPLRAHRRRLRAGQPRADHAAGRRASCCRSTPTTPTSSRPGSRSSRSIAPTPSGARAGAGRARADGARGAHALRRQLRRGRANIAQREAEVDARARRARARRGRPRAPRRSLIDSGAVSGEEMNHAQSGVSNARAALAAAEAALAAAQQQLATNQSLTDGTSVEKHPNVERAAAKVREAYLAYARTTLPSPVSGYVAKRTVQVGQRVAPGAPLMAIVPLDQLWVDAQLQGSAAAPDAHRPAGDADRGRLRQRGRIPRHGRGSRRRHRRRVRAAAGAERHRQLDQGRAARARAHRARSEGARRASAARRPVDGSRGRRRRHERARRSPTAPRTSAAYTTARSRTTPRKPTRWCGRPSPPISARGEGRRRARPAHDAPSARRARRRAPRTRVHAVAAKRAGRAALTAAPAPLRRC